MFSNEPKGMRLHIGVFLNDSNLPSGRLCSDILSEVFGNGTDLEFRHFFVKSIAKPENYFQTDTELIPDLEYMWIFIDNMSQVTTVTHFGA